MKINKLTFKKHERQTGLASVGYPHQDVVIKLDGKEVGYIDSPNYQSADNLWRIRFTVAKENWVKTPEDPCPCPWKWVVLKAKFEDEKSARVWLKEKCSAIVNDLKLYRRD